MQTSLSRAVTAPLIFFLLITLYLLVPSATLQAQGDLMFYPKRVVFDGSKRSQDLSIANNGNDTARYVISVIQIRMNEDGSFQTIDTPDAGQHFADKNFRFFPRTVVLPPHEAQTVKIQLYHFGNLTPGEYRSHLYFRAEDEKKPLEKEKVDTEAKSISINIQPVYGVSIPVIIRAGEADAQVQLSKIACKYEKDSMPTLHLNLDRSGTMSVYGDITVHHISEEGKEQLVGQVKGIAVYAPNNTRRIRLGLDRAKGIDYTKGALHVVYKDHAGNVVKIAQQQIYLH